MIHHSNIECDECGERHSPDHPVECRDCLNKQLAACRADLDVALNELGSALCAGDALRALLQRTLNYMRETDTARTAKEVIADLAAGLVVKS